MRLRTKVALGLTSVLVGAAATVHRLFASGLPLLAATSEEEPDKKAKKGKGPGGKKCK